VLLVRSGRVWITVSLTVLVQSERWTLVRRMRSTFSSSR
jgi:hypothetical protein